MYEYVALRWTVDHLGGAPHCHGDRVRLLSEGWEEYCRASWEPKGLGVVGGACIMRRPKDELRMWTEGEIVDLIRGGWARSRKYRDDTKEETNG